MTTTTENYHSPKETMKPSPPVQFATLISEIAYTTYLFIKSDIRTTLLPIAIFGLANAPNTTPSRAFPILFWVFLHLLQFNISNQYLPRFIIEDTNNKPDRPIPAGRISLARATQLRWALVPLCLALSSWYGTTVTCMSAIFLCMTAAYNELDGSSFWLPRDTINGTGFCAIQAASILIVNPSHKLTALDLTACVASALTFATTNFAQDFKDVLGDTLAKRNTIPVSFSQEYVRPAMLAVLVGWSILHTWLWELSLAVAAVYVGLGVFTGARFYFLRGLESDRTTYYYFYNLWLTTSFALPAYYRLVSSPQAILG